MPFDTGAINSKAAAAAAAADVSIAVGEGLQPGKLSCTKPAVSTQESGLLDIC